MEMARLYVGESLCIGDDGWAITKPGGSKGKEYLAVRSADDIVGIYVRWAPKRERSYQGTQISKSGPPAADFHSIVASSKFMGNLGCNNRSGLPPELARASRVTRPGQE